MSAADLLRRAATGMRERATQAAATGAWDWRSKDGRTYWSSATRAGRYIQSWHPDAAFEIADWLEECAEIKESDANVSIKIALTDRAIKIARAYLGESEC